MTAGTDAFAVPATFPSTAGESAGKTTPEELAGGVPRDVLRLACARSSAGAADTRGVTVTATITAEKGPGGIRIQSSHLRGNAAPSRLLLKARWRSPTTSSLDDFEDRLDSGLHDKLLNTAVDSNSREGRIALSDINEDDRAPYQNGEGEIERRSIRRRELVLALPFPVYGALRIGCQHNPLVLLRSTD